MNRQTYFQKTSFCLIFLLFSGLFFPLSHAQELIIKFKSRNPQRLGKLTAADSTLLQFMQKRSDFVSVKTLVPVSRGSRTLKKAASNPFSTVRILRFAEEKNLPQLIDSLNALPEIEYACRNKTMQIQQTPDDPDFAKQWGMSRIGILTAWEKTRGSAKMPVVVIDTGIDMQHEDLKNQIWINPGEDLNGNGTADSSDFNGVDDDGNGFIDDLTGWDFTDAPNYPDGGDYLQRDNDPSDEHGHGTAIAGILAAQADNGLGIAGAAPETKIVNLRAGTSQGLLEEDDVAAAILYAVEMKFRIINMSFGDVLITPLLRDVIRYAYQNNVVMIVSSGNSGDDRIHYPSGLAETISVGAVTRYDQRAGFSSFGSTLDLVAPGNAIFTTQLHNRYGEVSGTSASAPYVSAVAALLLANNPAFTAETVRAGILQSCEDLGSDGWDFEYGAGLLRADKALPDLGQATVKIVVPRQDEGFSQGSIPVAATCAGALISGYELAVGRGNLPNDWQRLTENQNHQIIADTLLYWQVPDGEDTSYTFRLRGFLRNGRSLDDYISIVVDHTPPVVTNFQLVPVVSSGKTGSLFGFDTDDLTTAQLSFRRGTANFQTQKLKFVNRRHAQLIPFHEQGDWEFYFTIRNQAELSADFPQTPSLLQVAVKTDRKIGDPFRENVPTFNSGYLLPFTTDMNGNGKPEVVLNEYLPNGNFGNLVYREFENGDFNRTVDTGLRLIPRDAADVNRDGTVELLAGAGRASVLLAGQPSTPFPKEIVWLDTNDVWAGRFYDFNGDGYPELLAKTGNLWQLWRNNRDFSFSPLLDLPNPTAGENGTGVPHVEFGDFDGDGKTEILFGDFDGDVYLYQISADLTAQPEWSDRLPLIDAIDFLAAGDFDGDGRPEFLTGCHSKDAIDLEHRFDERHWLFRIYDYNGGNYLPVWEQRFHPYFPPKDFDSGASCGDLDGDGAEEILLSLYPGLYVISFDPAVSQYHIIGYHEQVRSNGVVIHDFDHDNRVDLILNDGSRNRMFSFEPGIMNPSTGPANFSAVALDSMRVHLTWVNFVAPDSFRIYRGIRPENLRLIVPLFTQKSYIDSALVTGENYWYQISRVQSGGAEIFSKILRVTPHRPARVTELNTIDPNQLRLLFSLPMGKSAGEPENYRLRGSGRQPATAAQSGSLRQVILSWPENWRFTEQDTLLLTNLTDSSGTSLNERDKQVPVFTKQQYSSPPYIVRAQFKDSRHLQIEFSRKIAANGLLNSANYRLEPDIPVTGVTAIAPEQQAVELLLKPTRPVGPIGIKYDLYVSNLTDQNGIPLEQTIGNRVTFLFIANNLANVYVYPDPARFELIFANLTGEAEIEIFNISGILVKKLQVVTTDGGFNWNLRDENETGIPAGVYLYRVFNKKESHWGKFAVVK